MTHLRCPATQQVLVSAPEELVASLLARLADLQNAEGKSPEPFQGGLVTKDGQSFYPVRGGIPILLPGERVPLNPER